MDFSGNLTGDQLDRAEVLSRVRPMTHKESVGKARLTRPRRWQTDGTGIRVFLSSKRCQPNPVGMAGGRAPGIALRPIGLFPMPGVAGQALSRAEAWARVGLAPPTRNDRAASMGSSSERC